MLCVDYWVIIGNLDSFFDLIPEAELFRVSFLLSVEVMCTAQVLCRSSKHHGGSRDPHHGLRLLSSVYRSQMALLPVERTDEEFFYAERLPTQCCLTHPVVL
jgi:hypothetical protein